GRLDETDDMAGILDRVPAENALHAFQKRPDAAIAAVRYGAVPVDIKGDLLVLGADAPLLLRLAAFGDVGDQLVKRFDGPEIGGIACHQKSFRPSGQSMRCGRYRAALACPLAGPRLIGENMSSDQANSADKFVN